MPGHCDSCSEVAAAERWASTAAGKVRARVDELSMKMSKRTPGGVRAARVELMPLSAPEEATEGDQFL